MVDLLPEIEVVAEDAFNSHPTDTKLMGPDALERFRGGKQLPAVMVKTPLVSKHTVTALEYPGVSSILFHWTRQLGVKILPLALEKRRFGGNQELAPSPLIDKNIGGRSISSDLWVVNLPLSH